MSRATGLDDVRARHPRLREALAADARVTAALRFERHEFHSRLDAALQALRLCAQESGNTMPYILDAVRAYATVGEICDVLREVFGTYTEVVTF